MCFRPGEAFSWRVTAAASPALFRVLAAARAIHARERLREVFFDRGRHRQRHTGGNHQVHDCRQTRRERKFRSMEGAADAGWRHGGLVNRRVAESHYNRLAPDIPPDKWWLVQHSELARRER